ncbi:BQ5605_C033g11219 [Microbotryum silenes-dioicae]|uniref:BQ5605_C033g11219 protein n=1 Tax=Microbotryum silenes-dioicae TaxID=796604 RepID=A0A2X0N351_9BASI|nr:BQ5605_C033g11219 [Microbotryum silenes-dioicae]
MLHESEPFIEQERNAQSFADSGHLNRRQLRDHEIEGNQQRV